MLLPPSETKAEGGTGGPLDFDRLSWPELNPVRRTVADALVRLATDVPASLAALHLSPRQEPEVRRNALLYRGATMPALRRYTGVLYDALDAHAFSTARWRRAAGRLVISSALFGVVRADDPIPAYRCSGASALPGVGTLRALWRPALEPVLDSMGGLVVDLRSGPYAALARLPKAITVRVVERDAHGTRRTVSHHNKAYKGRLAQVLATVPTEPTDVMGLLAVVNAHGLRVEQVDERQLELVV